VFQYISKWLLGLLVVNSSVLVVNKMMVEEDQISFPSDAHMADGVEDYAHQIAEMIGLQDEFNFNEAG
jgi:putative pectin methyltransferase